MLAQVRMCLVTALFSSFVNDTPVFCSECPQAAGQLAPLQRAACVPLFESPPTGRAGLRQAAGAA